MVSLVLGSWIFLGRLFIMTTEGHGTKPELAARTEEDVRRLVDPSLVFGHLMFTNVFTLTRSTGAGPGRTHLQ